MSYWFPVSTSPSGFPKITDEEIKEVQRLNETFVSTHSQQPVDDIPIVIKTDSLQKVGPGPEPSFNPNLIVNCCDPNEIYQIGPNPLTNSSWVYAHSAQGVLDLYAITGATGLNITNDRQAFRANFLHTEDSQNQHITPEGCHRNTGYKCWRLAEQNPLAVVSQSGVASRIDLMPAKRYDSCENLNTMLTNGDWVSQVYNTSTQTMQPHYTYVNAITGLVQTDVYHIYPPCCTFNPNRIVNCCYPDEEWHICGSLLKKLTGPNTVSPSGLFLGATLGITSYTQSFRANFWFPFNQDPWNLVFVPPIPGVGNNWTTGTKCWHLKDSFNPYSSYAPLVESFAWTHIAPEVFPSCRHLNMHLYDTMVSPWPNWGSFYTGTTNPPWCGSKPWDITGAHEDYTPCEPCPPPDQTSPFYTTDNFCKRDCVDNQGNPLPNAPIDCGCCYPSPSPIVKTKCHCCNNQGQGVMPNNNDYIDCSTLDGTLPPSGMYNCVPVNQQLLCKNSLVVNKKRLTKPMIPTALIKWLSR